MYDNKYKMLETREKIIDYIKSAGQTMIDNAEDIVGNGEKLCDLSVWVYVDIDEIPTIEVSREYQVINYNRFEAADD